MSGCCCKRPRLDINIQEPLKTQDAYQSVLILPSTRLGCSCPRNEDGISGLFGVRACLYVCVCLLWCVYDIMMCGQLQAVRSSIVHRLAHSIIPLCVVYACVTRLVLRFTNGMLRALPVTPFSPCDAAGISRYTRPEGELCSTYGMYHTLLTAAAVVVLSFYAATLWAIACVRFSFSVNERTLQRPLRSKLRERCAHTWHFSPSAFHLSLENH